MSLELDIPTLLTPFDGEFRGGVDLRDDDDPNNLYRQVRDARKDARDEETQADLQGESSSDAIRQWREVWSNGQEYLQTVAKDLEIVAYMIEASVRLGGIGGLAQALNLTRELIENFWGEGELLPTPDEDGIETTILPIARLNGDAISYPLLRVPMTEDTSVGEFVVWQHTQARQLDSMSSEERDQRIARGAVTSELFNRAVAETSDEFYQNLAAEIDQAKDAVAALNQTFHEKAGEEDAPNLSRFTATLEEAEQVLKNIAGARLVDSESDGESGGGDEAAADGGAVAAPSGGAVGGGNRGEISNRNEAIEALEKVALWFERHEPQSILPAEIRKAKRRARMTPQELYMDLIADETVRGELFKDVGIEAPAEEDGSY